MELGTLIAVVLGSSLLVKLADIAYDRWKLRHNEEKEHSYATCEAAKGFRNLEKKIDDLGVQNKYQMAAIGNLLGHILDGNHTVQLRKDQRQLEEYLIERMN